VRLSLSGEMDARKLPGMFRDAAEKLRRTQAGSVEIDASQLHCGDSTCLALLAEIRREAARTGGKVSVVGAGPDLQALIDLATLGNPLAPELRPPPPLGIVAGVGATVANALKELRALVAFFGELCAAFAWAAVHPRQVRWRNFVAGCESAGANAAIVVMVLGFLIGVMLAFQSAEQTEKYGVRTVVASVVAIAVTRELGPLITALLLAGRTASALAAEMGTMKIDDELNALRVMGLDPVRFLAIPQVLAVVVVTPLLTAICDGAGILGGYSVMADHGTTFIHYIVQVRDSLHAWDVFGGMLKTTICGLVIAMVGCLRGIRSGDGPRAVGHSTTSAVVISILLVVAIDGAFGVVYYYLGV
jgi:phospholipid/cholesterol/gamma-HCH transport system permease protein